MSEVKSFNVKTGGGAQIDFTVGADPELTICEGTQVIKGSVLTEQDEFGVDGNGVSFEIRPDPSTNPLESVNNCRGIMVRQCLKNPKFLSYDWFAGGWQRDYPLGGHIHFGIKANVIPHRKACNILSQYVGAATVLIEDREQGQKRRNVREYGGMEDHREQPYGFEYRSPSSWLTSPYVAAGIMCLAKTVMYEVLNNDKFKVPNRVKPEHFKNMDTESLRALWPDIWREITQMSQYQQYKPYIDFICYLVTKKNKNGSNLSWFPSCSLKEAWGIVDVNSAGVSKLNLKAIWQNYKTKKEEFVRKEIAKSSYGFGGGYNW